MSPPYFLGGNSDGLLQPRGSECPLPGGHSGAGVLWHVCQAYLVVVMALALAAVGATKAVEEVHDSTMAATTHRPARKEDIGSLETKGALKAFVRADRGGRVVGAPSTRGGNRYEVNEVRGGG